jgi:AraC family transcriptional regulator
VDDGVSITTAELSHFTIVELGFPPGYVQAPYEPERPYLALVLDGAMEKSFALRTVSFGRTSALTMPVGARHGARFGSEGARILVVRPKDETSEVAASLRRVVELKGDGFGWLASRLADELHASDAVAPLAAEGLVLQLFANTTRARSREPRRRRAPAWLPAAEELLRERTAQAVGLSELASQLGVHAGHLAREFRACHGMSVGEYGRRVRLSWAATELVSGDRSLAEVAAEAGFADQSHFTRLFKRHVGTTPARYRRDARHVPG